MFCIFKTFCFHAFEQIYVNPVLKLLLVISYFLNLHAHQSLSTALLYCNGIGPFNSSGSVYIETVQ